MDTYKYIGMSAGYTEEGAPLAPGDTVDLKDVSAYYQGMLDEGTLVKLEEEKAKAPSRSSGSKDKEE